MPMMTSLASMSRLFWMHCFSLRYIRLSMASRSIEKRFRMRPRGVASKNDTGLDSTQLSIPLCSDWESCRALAAIMVLPTARKTTSATEIARSPLTQTACSDGPASGKASIHSLIQMSCQAYIAPLPTKARSAR
uniref:Putative secreted protein n=1 Tax=Ixodes ricinus TaxID=34613 RepID=A0A6B0US08_IXORI